MRLASASLVYLLSGVICAGWANAASLLPPPPDTLPTAVASPTPSPVASSPGAGTIVPLREIGRVRVATAYCTALHDSTAPAVESALSYDDASVTTVADILRLAHSTNPMQRNILGNQVNQDLRDLTDMSHAGGDKLQGLRTLATTATREQATELLGLRNALDGAKGRQYLLAKKIAAFAGSVSGRPTTSFTDPSTLALLNAIGPEPGTVSVRARAFVASLLPVEDTSHIQQDLVDAGSHAQNAISLGDCAPQDDAEAGSAATPEPPTTP